MNSKINPQNILIFVLLIFTTNCSFINFTENEQQTYLNYPSEDINADLRYVFRSMVMPQCYVAYREYNFSASAGVTRGNVKKYIQSYDQKSNINRENSVGSGIIIASKEDKILILSAAHIYDYPDRIYKNFNQQSYQDNISVFAEKVNQKQYIVTNNEIVSLEKFIQDKSKDIILLIGREVTDSVSLNINKFKFGDSSLLGLGNFVYLFGFPAGRKMISNGIMSPLKDKNEFLINTPFNRGMSGGTVFGMTKYDSEISLELLGIATSSAAKHNYILRPDKKSRIENYNRSLPYQGQLYIKRKSNLKYGVTYVTGINSVKEFLSENQAKIEQEGFNVNHIINNNSNEK